MATRIVSRSANGGRPWRLSTVGRFALVDAACDQVAVLPTRKACAIVAFLCSHPDQRFTRERIAALLWGDRGEAQARASLRQALLEIRHATAAGAPILKSDRTHIWAEPASIEPEALDQTSWAGSDELLFDDLGNISPDFDEWLAVARADRSRRLADALRNEVERLLDCGRGAVALPLVDRLHRLDPFDEHALRLALRAEFQAGRAAGIEQRVREMECRLRDELGVALSSESRALRDQLLQALAQPKPLQPAERPAAGRGKAVAAAPIAEAKQSIRFSGTRRIWAGAAIAVALLAIAAAFWARRTVTPPTWSPTVALLPFTAEFSDADARKLAAATRDAVAHAVAQGSFSVSTIDAARQGRSAPIS